MSKYLQNRKDYCLLYYCPNIIRYDFSRLIVRLLLGLKPIFLLSENANRIDNALIFTNDFDEVKKFLSEAPSGKNDNWDAFKDYLEENSPNTYAKVKKLGKLVDFIIKSS
ncbi:unnamed protein product [marine sediment metagenome]|uniref:Uncharacterized protein n=1 Tax=marine sediment metagenome TaxID=412755 RepID=X1MQ58_9ZZZZ